MIVRATKKLLNTSGIKPVKNLSEPYSVMPGEWYAGLVFLFQLHNETEIFTTNSRSMLSHMTQLKYPIEYHFALSETFEEINYDEIEDLLSDMLLSSSGPRKYEKPVELIRRLADQ